MGACTTLSHPHIFLMESTPQLTSSDYRLRVEPLSAPVRILLGDTVIAESSDARLMRETRLPDGVYVPQEDVRIPLGETSDFRTFCPFKGTARYGEISVGGENRANAWWTYPDTLPEAAAIEGMVSFTPTDDITIDYGENNLPGNEDGPIAGPLVNWLLREAGACSSPEELTRQFAERLGADGVAVSRLSVLIWSLHPMIAGRNYVWSKQKDKVAVYTPNYDIHTSPAFVNSPLKHVSDGLGGVRQRLDVPDPEFTFSIMDDLRAEGATDYVAMPLVFSDGQINVLTLTSDHPDGFTTANLGLIYEMSFVLSRYFEVFTQRDNSRTLLGTYLGERSGGRVLGGEITRGHGDEIDAAILLCDLRNSTAHEERLGRTDYLDFLNRFFEEVTDVVTANGGEVLKFIGDAVLAVFPVTGSEGEACRNAATSARQIVAHLDVAEKDMRCAIGSAFGTVTYGNVGSRERLDFTVIGRAANIAARLADACKGHDTSVLVTQDIAEGDAGARHVGDLELRNVSEVVGAYSLT
jgi:adenylate cyclase